MRLKLLEAAQPIDKLKYNIEKNILPRLSKYGLSFSSEPTKVNKFKYLYNGVSKGLSNQLSLSTSNVLIDEWNETNSDIFVADLYGELKMNGQIEPLGALSSKNPDSVDEAMKEVNIENNKFVSQEKLDDITIIEPKHKGSGLEPMSKEDWIKLKNDLETELNDIKLQLQKADEANDDETYYN